VVGTAGHIDHGKSSLVKRLTGIDPDRLKEEKERGMTIDLGFARTRLPDGRTVGIVDVPGHERFVRNMVAGATGIDVVMLVVAADDGVMPQTREHLQIMDLLGVRSGFVALNKVDLVEPDIAELAAEDVRAAVAGTFLEGAPIVPVSAVTGQGLAELEALLCACAARATPRSDEGVFRMPVQRVFSSPGFGTVLTGIPLGGSVRTGDVLGVVPGEQRGKVRGIHAYGQPVERARAGHSSALNLPDVDAHAVQRGCVVCTPGFFEPVSLLGARLSVLPACPFPVTNRMQVRLHVGTAEALGEVVLLDSPELAPGASGLVQLRLAEPVACAPGDRFVLRLASPSVTLGGGVVLEESRHRLKRFKGFVIDELTHQEASLGSPAALLESVLARAGLEPQEERALAQAIKRSGAETARLLAGLAERGVAGALAGGTSHTRWVHAAALEQAGQRLSAAMEAWFSEQAHRRVVKVLELKQRTGLDATLLSGLLEREAAAGKLALESGGVVRPLRRALELDPAAAARRERLLARLTAARFQPPAPSELALELGCPEAEARRTLELLVDEGCVRRVQPDLFLAESVAEEARAAIVANCTRHGHLAIPELRDELRTTRKYLIPLLEHFDVQGLTLRQGANRVLRRS
jgi:selenocysteine-specific elongation factor